MLEHLFQEMKSEGCGEQQNGEKGMKTAIHDLQTKDPWGFQNKDNSREKNDSKKASLGQLVTEWWFCKYSSRTPYTGLALLSADNQPK